MIINAIIKKELLQLSRNPQLIALNVGIPLKLKKLFGMALKLEPANVKMAYLDQDQSIFSHLIKTQLWSEGYFQLYEVDSKQQIIEEIRAGRARAGLHIAADFSELLIENKQPHVLFYRS